MVLEGRSIDRAGGKRKVGMLCKSYAQAGKKKEVVPSTGLRSLALRSLSGRSSGAWDYVKRMARREGDEGVRVGIGGEENGDRWREGDGLLLVKVDKPVLRLALLSP